MYDGQIETGGGGQEVPAGAETFGFVSATMLCRVCAYRVQPRRTGSSLEADHGMYLYAECVNAVYFVHGQIVK
jgi:hypothetical protein